MRVTDVVDSYAVVDSSECQIVDNRDLLRSVFLFLDETERHVFCLLAWGKTQNEIAQTMGYSDHSAASHLIARARKRIAKRM